MQAAPAPDTTTATAHAAAHATPSRALHARWRRDGLRRDLTLCGIASLIALILAGCTTTIIPPADVDEPRTVYLLDHGHTSSLVLPADNNAMVRYAYGDYEYYALKHRGVLQGAAALLWPTDATLGRKALTADANADAVADEVGVHTEAVYEVRVDAARIASLRTQLDDRFNARGDEAIDNTSADLRFVHTSPKYHLFNNSNSVVGDWLSELGCDVRGMALTSNWRIAEREQAPPRHGH